MGWVSERFTGRLESGMMMRTCVLSIVVMLTVLSGRPGDGADRVSFNHDVRPILSDKCFFCHGPDAERREADLRLDDRAVAIEAGAINVGKPDASELIRRVLSTDADEQMPPPATKLGHLTPQEIERSKPGLSRGPSMRIIGRLFRCRPCRRTTRA